MLDHEYGLLVERLSATRGDRTNFFVFANTVATSNHQGTNEAHGWLGIRFQAAPLSEPSEIVLHVRMWDKDTVLQQQALGIVGVNLIYGALYLRSDPRQLIESLQGQPRLSDRIEVDMLPLFRGTVSRTNRQPPHVASPRGIQAQANAGHVRSRRAKSSQPSEILHKKAIVVERGSFRPVTHVNVDMIACAMAQFVQESQVKGKEVVVLMEITMNRFALRGRDRCP